uniref:Pleckstrin homology domain containing A5 n=1 Tax=Naja naja TaxID=35670 RepID=A0A8C6X2V4_NAJNA
MLCLCNAWEQSFPLAESFKKTEVSKTSEVTSRSSKKVHNFGKRSNSIKRNPNAPVVRRGWLYKQDSTGMKLWKKRWFVLSDLCLFYYRDEKEEGILGSILLPSFQIAMLSSEDHINRKYAFKVRIFFNFAFTVFYISVEYNCEHMNYRKELRTVSEM